MPTNSTILSLIAACALWGCAEGTTSSTDLSDRSPVNVPEDAGSNMTPTEPSTSDAGEATTLDAGQRSSGGNQGRTDAGTVHVTTDAGGGGTDTGTPPTLSGLVLYDDAVSSKFVMFLPHATPDTAQMSNNDTAYLLVNDSYSGPEAKYGKSLKVDFITMSNMGNFGMPLMFWLGEVGYANDPIEDISSKKAIHFSIRAESGSGMFNVLVMHKEATSTSRTIPVSSQWTDVTLSTSAGADWTQHSPESFSKFRLLQFNFLGGANPPNGFKGPAVIYIDNIYID